MSIDPKGKGSPTTLDTAPAAADEEVDRRPLLKLALPSQQSLGPVPPVQSYGYGATASSGSSSLRASPERYRRDSLLGRVPEEGGPANHEAFGEAEEDDWDLEERGFYIGSYKRNVAMYSFVPISSLLAFIFLATLPTLIWHNQHRGSPTYSRYFAPPLPELLVSAALWSMSYLLRVPLYNVTSAIFPSPLLQTFLFNIVYVLLSQLLRLSALPILRIRHEMQYPLPTWRDPAFHRVWWVALGWALADVMAGVAQGYAEIALYRDVMIPEEGVQDLRAKWKYSDVGNGVRKRFASPEENLPLSPRPGPAEDGQLANEYDERSRASARRLEDIIKSAVDRDLEQLVNLKEREELEEIYGIPPIKIPVFVSCLQRIDSSILSLGTTLILAGAYLRSSLSFPDTNLPPIYTNRVFFITFPLVVLFHTLLSLLHTPPVLSRIGVHVTAYIGLLAGLSGVFAGLAFWEALS
ncbi:hypothetical protein AcV5_010309 [Taiwanofungus camphoratus]|nr:hypothetical protein AcV5_010309 [Antrodia cinnamomea]